MNEGPPAKLRIIRFLGFVQIPLIVIASCILLYLGLHVVPLVEREKALTLEISELQEQLDQKKAALKDLNEQQEKLVAGISSLKRLITVDGGAKIKAAAEQIPWWQQLAPKASAQPTGKKSPNGELHKMSLWLEGPASTLTRIQRVEYFFDHPSFNPKTKLSTNPADGFKITYLGWGCLNSVRITIIPNEGDRLAATAFNMCASLLDFAGGGGEIQTSR